MCIQISVFCNWVVITTHTLITLALIWTIIKHRSPSGLLVILGNFAFSFCSVCLFFAFSNGFFPSLSRFFRVWITCTQNVGSFIQILSLRTFFCALMTSISAGWLQKQQSGRDLGLRPHRALQVLYSWKSVLYPPRSPNPNLSHWGKLPDWEQWNNNASSLWKANRKLWS